MNHLSQAISSIMSCVRRDGCDNQMTPFTDNGIYHEKQSKEMCALHALNNLYQDANAFSRKQLDEICFSLSPNHLVNPHKSFFGLGNYDVNVIMAAVQTKFCEAIWFDKRRNIDDIAFDNVFGFILNIPIEYKLAFLKFPSHRKHWIGIRQIDGLYYNLDSKLDAAEVIGASSELCAYLKDQLSCKEKELLLIVQRPVAEYRTWLKLQADSLNANNSSSVDNRRGEVIMSRLDDTVNANSAVK